MDEEIQRLRTEAAQIECLYELDAMLREESSEPLSLYQDVAALLPRGFRFPDDCKVSITLEDIFAANRDERPTEFRIRERILRDGQAVGEVMVSYVKAFRPEKGAFLPGEKRFLRSVADKIGDHLLIRQLRENLRQQDAQSGPDQKTGFEPELIQGLEQLGFPAQTVLAGLQAPLHFKKGEMFNKQGSENPYLYLLARGYIKNYIETGGDRKLVFKIVRPVDWIGTPLISGRSSLFFSSVALTDATVYPVHKDDIRNMEGDVAGIIHQRFLVSMEANYTRLARLMTSQALGRVAIVLLYLAENVFRSELIPSLISRRDIAAMAGMALESAVRMLSILRSDGIIATGTQGITILDDRMLRTISHA